MEESIPIGRIIPHWYDWKVIVPFTLTPVFIGLVIAFVLPAVQRFRSSEANAAMLASPAPIDGKRAYGYLKKICEIGPRLAGSPENARQRKMVADHFTKMGGQVREQPFQAEHPLTGRRVDMVDLIGSWHPDRQQRVLISALRHAALRRSRGRCRSPQTAFPCAQRLCLGSCPPHGDRPPSRQDRDDRGH